MNYATQQWKETLERLRFERKRFAERATQRRKDAIECRRKRDWLGALQEDDRAGEYRRSRDQLDEEIKKIRKQTGLR